MTAKTSRSTRSIIIKYFRTLCLCLRINVTDDRKWKLWRKCFFYRQVFRSVNNCLQYVCYPHDTSAIFFHDQESTSQSDIKSCSAEFATSSTIKIFYEIYLLLCTSILTLRCTVSLHYTSFESAQDTKVSQKIVWVLSLFCLQSGSLTQQVLTDEVILWKHSDHNKRRQGLALRTCSTLSIQYRIYMYQRRDMGGTSLFWRIETRNFLSQQSAVCLLLSKSVYISKQISFTQFNRNFPLKKLQYGGGGGKVVLRGTSSAMKQGLETCVPGRARFLRGAALLTRTCSHITEVSVASSKTSFRFRTIHWSVHNNVWVLCRKISCGTGRINPKEVNFCSLFPLLAFVSAFSLRLSVRFMLIC
jgi:hypothetical protein